MTMNWYRSETWMETPVWFNMPAARTVESCGVKTVLLKTTGNEKTRFTVVLSCLADGTKLKPMVIFRQKTLPKGQILSWCFGSRSSKGLDGWRRCEIVDREGVAYKTWWCKQFQEPPCLGFLLALTWVILQSSSWKEIVQLKQSFQGAWWAWCSHFDVCLNKPFQRPFWGRNRCSGWSTERRPSPLLEIWFCEWVKDTWQNIPSEMVVRSFKKCGISNAIYDDRINCGAASGTLWRRAMMKRSFSASNLEKL